MSVNANRATDTRVINHVIYRLIFESEKAAYFLEIARSTRLERGDNVRLSTDDSLSLMKGSLVKDFKTSSFSILLKSKKIF